MSFVQDLISDLREKRLWPLAVILVVALVAVPVVISSGGNGGVPVAQIPPVAASPNVPSLPTVSVTPTPSDARLTGPEHNPFHQQAAKPSGSSHSGSSTSTTSTTTSPGSKSSSSSGSSSNSSSSPVTGSPSTGTATVPASTPSPTLPSTPAAPPVTTLTDTQSYHVAISLTNTSGGAYILDPVERLSPIPSDQLPLLVELGVLRGGHRVLFAVQPGTVVQGPGRCTPGPIDCEVMSLAPNQIEGVATAKPDGSVTGALMAVTTIKADQYSSAAAADRARQAESAAGRRLLAASQQKALALFPYQLATGALADLSNVTVGGN